MKLFCSDQPYLIGNNLSFLFLCFFLIVYPKLKLFTKIGLTYAVVLAKWYQEFLSKKMLFTYVCWIWIINNINNIVNIAEKLNKRNLLKICLQPSLQICA